MVAYEILCRIELFGAFSDYAVHSDAVAQIAPTDRNLATEIVYGTLRWRALLDYILANACSREWWKVEPETQILLRMSAYQMVRMERIPDHALVHDGVEIAKKKLHRGIEGFVNGILRQLARTKSWESDSFARECPAWATVSLPPWLWERWRARFGEPAARSFALSLNQPPQAAFHVPHHSRHKGTVASDIVPDAYIGGREAAVEHPAPRAHVQDEASQLIPHLLGAAQGWRVWDACAAPGGKSAILDDQCGNSGLVVSSDVHPHRVQRMNARFSAEGRRIRTVVADARRPPFRMCFDAAVADAPCSGLGTLRRNPEIKWRFEPKQFRELQSRQLAILTAVSEAVRPGGVLLYSTCSTEPEENEQVVNRFLEARPHFRLVRPGGPKGVDVWLDEAGLVHTFPAGGKLWDGFFAALMLYAPYV
jgi:16S rRNA (cytosine967-C5)-methyltransferase